MKITYNLQVLPQRKNSRKDSEETTALKAFLADSEKKNMVFEYDTPQEAKKRYDSIVGDFSFRLEEAEFEDLMADVREKVGFTQELVCAELKGRLFDEV